MRILFISMVPFEDNSSATIQNKGIVEGLYKCENEVDIMTLMPMNNSLGYDDSMDNVKSFVNNVYYIEVDRKYAVLRTKKEKLNNEELHIKNTEYRTNIINRIYSKIRVIIKNLYKNIAIFDAQKVNVKGVSKLNIDYSKYDIIISASDPKSSHLIAERIYKKNKNCNARWIQYWGDPMLNDITRESNWRDRLVKYNENKLINEANKVVYASPLTLKIQKETYPRHTCKMDYTSQAYTNINSMYRSKEKNSNILVGYFGAYNSKIRNIKPLYNVAKEEGFMLNICGASDITLKCTKNIYVTGMISYRKAVEMEEKTDILVCICNRRGTQIPGKVYYCASYKKPIVVILDGEYEEELGDYLNSFKRFILCKNQEQSIRDAIERAKKQLDKGEYYISEQLTPEYVARKILKNI
ncbi:hypothetical protein [Clostridium sp. JS66]|uniref:hypothetical protein n=1 Tax=Clostridium sp. JS66 TaxID=3064705 RepID=UPI00298E24C9|nr:hypothetical protein [Clostridium sp. JS66]WPC43287.1 hypothetical protein Q6H37_07390 [Clostridium sp. JS66]